MSEETPTDTHKNPLQAEAPVSETLEAMDSWERKKSSILSSMEMLQPQADILAQRSFGCARLLLQLQNLMVDEDRIQEIQKITYIAPDSDETMDFPHFITYDAISMMIFVRALKLQDTTSRFINEDIYSDLNLTDRMKQDKHLLAKIRHLDIQSASEDFLSDSLDEHRRLHKVRVYRKISKLTATVVLQSTLVVSRSPHALPRPSRILANSNQYQSYPIAPRDQPVKHER